MNLALGLVIEFDLATDQLNVIHRKMRRITRRLVLGLHPLIEQIGNIVAPFGYAGDGQPQASQSDFINHGRQFEDGG